jgi:hypothetical protein
MSSCCGAPAAYVCTAAVRRPMIAPGVRPSITRPVHDLLHPLGAEQLFVRVHRLGESVRQHEQDVSRRELHGLFFIGAVLLHPEGKPHARRVEPAQFSPALEKRSCLSGVGERQGLPRRVERRHEKCNEVPALRMGEYRFVQPREDHRGRRRLIDLPRNRPDREDGGHRRLHPFPRDVEDRDAEHPAVRPELCVVEQVPPHVRRRDGDPRNLKPGERRIGLRHERDLHVVRQFELGLKRFLLSAFQGDDPRDQVHRSEDQGSRDHQGHEPGADLDERGDEPERDQRVRSDDEPEPVRGDVLIDPVRPEEGEHERVEEARALG